MRTALYATIWTALVLFVLAQHGRRRLPVGPWVVWTNVLGLALCVAHIAIAMAFVHGWSHAAAAGATAAETEAVYGLRWGGGLYVNYLFVLVWALDAWRGHAINSPVARWSIRSFYAIVIVNAAIVFARGWIRPVGVALIAALLLAWRPTPFRRPL